MLDATIEQANRVCCPSRAVFENEPNQQLAKRLIDLAGPDFHQALFLSSGSEATEAAIKLACQQAIAKGEISRKIVLTQYSSYHRAILGAASVTGDLQIRQGI